MDQFKGGGSGTLNNSLGDRLNVIEYFENSVGVSYKTEKPTTFIDPEITLSYNKTQMTAFDVFAGGVTTDIGSDVTAINGKAANTFTIGKAKVTAGLDFYHDEATGTYERKPATPNQGATNREVASDVGLFTQIRMPVTKDFRMSFGARGDHQWFEGIEGSTFNNFGLSGNVNAEYDIQPWLTAFAGAGTTFGGIPFGEPAIYNFSGVWNYTGLKPSRSRNYKGGFQVNHRGFKGEASLFHNKIDDQHDLSSTNRSDVNTLVTRGGSVSGGYHYADGFVRGGFTRTIVRLNGGVPASTSANYYGVIAGDKFTLEAAHSFRSVGVKVGSSNEFYLSEEESNGVELPGYVVLNVYGEWSPTFFKKLSVRVDAKNLLDQGYVDRATAGYDSSTVNPYYEPGRTFLLSAKMSF